MSEKGLNVETSSSGSLARWFKFDQFEPESAVTSNFVSPLVLAVIRGIIFIYSFVALWIDVANAIINNQMSTYFCFFTHLTFIGLISYQATALYHSIYYLCTPFPHKPASFTNQHWLFTYLYWVLYDTVVTFNILVPVVFWALLSAPLIRSGASSLLWYDNVSAHALTFAMMLTDVLLNRMRLITRHSLFVFVITLFYTFETWITHATLGFWVYPFLSWSQGPIAVVWYLAVGVFLILCFLGQVCIHRLRDYIGWKVNGTYAGRPTDMIQQTTLEEQV